MAVDPRSFPDALSGTTSGSPPGWCGMDAAGLADLGGRERAAAVALGARLVTGLLGSHALSRRIISPLM